MIFPPLKVLLNKIAFTRGDVYAFCVVCDPIEVHRREHRITIQNFLSVDFQVFLGHSDASEILESGTGRTCDLSVSVQIDAPGQEIDVEISFLGLASDRRDVCVRESVSDADDDAG